MQLNFAAIILLIIQVLQITSCVIVKDSDGNSVYISEHGSKVTSPKEQPVYEYDSDSGRSTTYNDSGSIEESVIYRDE